MIPIGEPYKPTGRFDVSATVFATVTGLFAAAVVAALIWGWEISGLPTLLLITSLIQGLAIGAALMWLFRRARLRNTKVAALLAAACALFSVALVDYGHYLWFLRDMEPMVARELDAEHGKISAERRSELLARVHADPARAADALVLEPKTHHHGFLGFMMLRASVGESISSHGSSGTPITGWACWGLWILEAGFVVGTAVGLTHAQAKKPFCEDCGRWFGEPVRAMYVPVARAQELVAAVTSCDPAKVAPLHGMVNLSPGSADARIYSCPDCAARLADVISRMPTNKKADQVRPLMPAISISPELEVALRTPPPKQRATAEPAAATAAPPGQP